jgi:MoxR-like ATPase
MFKVRVDYPSASEEALVVDRSLEPAADVEKVLSPERLIESQRAAAEIFVDRGVNEYAVALCAATRSPADHGLDDLARYIEYGASPRGSINLIHAGRALALLRGRGYVLPEDVESLAHDVLRHRLVLTYEALADEIDADTILDRVIAAVKAPTVSLSKSEEAVA